jgi:hypothetical protein
MNETISLGGVPVVGFGQSQTTTSATSTLKSAAIGAVTLGLIGAGVGAGISYVGEGQVDGGTVVRAGVVGALVGGVAGAIL